MNVEIFCVSYHKDASWIPYLTRSIAKFCSGFSGVTLLVPYQDILVFESLQLAAVKLVTFVENREFAFNDHQAQVCLADTWCQKASHILHIDSDCIFTKPTCPDDYFVNGRPVLLKESFDEIRKGGNSNRLCWQIAAQNALGWPVSHETMCRHPAVHATSIYNRVRRRIETVHDKKFHDYVLEQKNDYPQGFCEFSTLGGFALSECADDYHWIEVGKNALPEDHIKQFWSHHGAESAREEIERLLE